MNSAITRFALGLGFARAAADGCEQNDHYVDPTALPFASAGIHQCQYAGTFQVGPAVGSDNHNLFYWFFRHEDENAPLVLWLNGGPGSSSMFGLFLEGGPLRVTRTGSGIDDLKLGPAVDSWADTYNIVFLDQPVNTGFSFGDTTLTSMQDGSKEFVNFLVQFYEKYPELKENEFYLTGESYAGKYLPLFTHDILERNKNLGPSDIFIPLEFTLIIDPYPAPATQRTRMH